MAQANQVTFLQVEQRSAIHHSMQQAIFNDEQLVAREYLGEIIGSLKVQWRTCRCKAIKQLGGDALKSVNQLIGVGRLLPE